jgi:hypothetical protein
MYKYQLEPYGGPQSRHTCPNCENRRNTFTRYIDTETGGYLADHAGKCNRLEQCGYHYPPREFFKENPGYKPQTNITMKKPPKPTHFDTIPDLIIASTLRGYDKNNFSMFLARMFGAEGAIRLIEKYKVGCAKHWPGATIFWQIDINDKVRTGKIMLYNRKDCKRVKEPFSHIAWAHKLMSPKPVVESLKSETAADSLIKTQDFRLETKDFALRQCLFGEHLLKLEPFNIVAIAESEKTAIIASMYLPGYTWLAAGSMEGLTVEKCKVLAGRTIRLYPDVNAYAKWHTKARELNRRIPSATFVVDNTLTINPTRYDRERGVDIADKWIDSKLLEWGGGSQ